MERESLFFLLSISICSGDLNHFFLIDLFVITTLIADETCSLSRFAFYLHFHWCSQVGVIDFHIWKWHCEDLSSYKTITLLLQNQLTWTHLVTTAYISHLPNPTPSHCLSSIRLPKCLRNEKCFIFLQEIGRKITKSIFTVLKYEMIFLFIST